MVPILLYCYPHTVQMGRGNKGLKLHMCLYHSVMTLTTLHFTHGPVWSDAKIAPTRIGDEPWIGERVYCCHHRYINFIRCCEVERCPRPTMLPQAALRGYYCSRRTVYGNVTLI